MKRFTATEKWSKEWYQELSPRLKCLWQFVCDHADAAGVWEPNFRLASFQIGEPVSEVDLTHFTGRMEKLPNGKFLISGFIEFQYGKLSRECKAHIPVFRALEKHNITKSYPKAIDSLQEKEKEEDKEKEGIPEGSGEGNQPPPSAPPAESPQVVGTAALEQRCAELTSLFSEITGHKITASYQRQQTWCEFIRRGFTEDDLRLVVRWLTGQIAQGQGGFTRQSLQFGTLLQDLDRFEDKLNTARSAKLPQTGPPRATTPPPAAWREWALAKYPTATVTTWEALPEDVRAECRRELTKR